MLVRKKSNITRTSIVWKQFVNFLNKKLNQRFMVQIIFIYSKSFMFVFFHLSWTEREWERNERESELDIFEDREKEMS